VLRKVPGQKTLVLSDSSQAAYYFRRGLGVTILPLGGRMDLDELFRAVANHPIIVLAVATIIVLMLAKSFNQLK
jgi:hypothetical protein